MTTMTVADFKAHFSAVVAELKNGNEVVITYGRSKEPLATVIPQSKFKQPDYAVRMGDLKDAGLTYKTHHFEMTEDELIGI